LKYSEEYLSSYKKELEHMAESIPVEDKSSMEFASEMVRAYGTKEQKSLMNLFDYIADKNPSFKKWREDSKFNLIKSTNYDNSSMYYAGSKSVIHNPYYYIDSIPKGKDFKSITAEIAAHEMVHAFTTDIFNLGRLNKVVGDSYLKTAKIDPKYSKLAQNSVENIEKHMETYVKEKIFELGKFKTKREMDSFLESSYKEADYPKIKNLFGDVKERKIDHYYYTLKNMGYKRTYPIFGTIKKLDDPRAKLNPDAFQNSFNPDEFVAHLLTDRNFQKELSKYKVGNQNIYEKIKNILYELISQVGLGTKNTIGSEAAKEIIQTIENMDFTNINNKIKNIDSQSPRATLPGVIESKLKEGNIETVNKKAYGGLLNKKKYEVGGKLDESSSVDFQLWQGLDHEQHPQGGIQVNDEGIKDPSGKNLIEGDEVVIDGYAFSKRLTL